MKNTRAHKAIMIGSLATLLSGVTSFLGTAIAGISGVDGWSFSWKNVYWGGLSWWPLLFIGYFASLAILQKAMKKLRSEVLSSLALVLLAGFLTASEILLLLALTSSYPLVKAGASNVIHFYWVELWGDMKFLHPVGFVTSYIVLKIKREQIPRTDVSGLQKNVEFYS